MSECFKIVKSQVEADGKVFDIGYEVEISHQGPIEMVEVEVHCRNAWGNDLDPDYEKGIERFIKLPYCTKCGLFVKGD